MGTVRASRDVSAGIVATTRSLGNTITSLYRLAGFTTVALGLVWVGIVYFLAQVHPLMEAFTVFIVTIVAISLFARRGKFGEAALALVAGLFPALTVDWTVDAFVMFNVAWAGLSLSAIGIASVKLAARSESIYTEASNVASLDNRSITRTTLERIAAADEETILGPIEKADVILSFAYGGLAVEAMPLALTMTGVYAAITRLDHVILAAFVADLAEMFGAEFINDHESVRERAYRTMRNSRVPPARFIDAFENSKAFGFNRSISAWDYFDRLADALSRGVPPNEIASYLSGQLPIR